MTTLITTNQNSTYFVSSNGHYVFLPNIYVDGGSAAAIAVSAISANIAIGGTLVGAHGVSVNGGDSVTLSATGAIYAEQRPGNFYSAGVEWAGDDNEVFIDGTISMSDTSTTTTAGLYGTGNNNRTVVTGTVQGSDIGIYAYSSDNNLFTVSASGTVIGGSSGAIGVSGGNTNAENEIVNAGTIVAGSSGIAISNLSFSGADAFDQLNVENSGLIVGDVNLFGGDDTYDGSGTGRVVGTVDGGEGNDELIGGMSRDTFLGSGGHDVLIGGGGNDLLVGGSGSDVLVGDEGRDTAGYQDAASGLTADLLLAQVNTGDANGDSYLDIENLRGSRFNDTLRGDENSNLLQGLSGADLMYGRNGNDALLGDAGRDSLYGQNGDDVLFGGADGDNLYGGAGLDRFRYDETAESDGSALDRIRDFSQADGDLIDVSRIDAASSLSGDQTFNFIGSATFTGTEGELRVIYNAGNNTTLVQADVDGNGTSDFAIGVIGNVGLTADDFIL